MGLLRVGRGARPRRTGPVCAGSLCALRAAASIDQTCRVLIDSAGFVSWPSGAVTSVLPGFCGIGSSGVPGEAVSESGRLRRGAGGHPRDAHRRRVLVLPTLRHERGRSRVAHVGRSVKRREDERLLQGRGAYVADVRRPFTLHLALVRSPHAHARIRGIDVHAARAHPGVVDVVMFADIPALARPIPMPLAEGGQMSRYLQRPLAHDKVRYVGEPVVAVVADDRYRAEDALAHVRVDYEPLPPVVDTKAAAQVGAPLLFESEETNVVAAYTVGCGDVERGLADADVVLRETFDEIGRAHV